MFGIEAATSAVTYCTLALVLGCLATVAVLLPHGEPTDLRVALYSLALKLLPLYIAAAVVALLFQGAKLNGGQFPSFDILDRYLRYTQSGKIWAMRQGYALLLLAGLFGCRRSSRNLAVPRLFLLLLLPLVASRSLTSHAVAVREATIVAVSTDALHLLATAFWAGGLPILFWVLYRGTKKLHLITSWTAETVRRFSALALVAVTVLALTGLYQSWIQVQQLGLLFETAYGQVLMLKLLLFFCMIIVGAVNFFSTKPKLVHSVKTEKLPNWLRKTMLRRIGGEALLGVGVFCVTGFLTLLPPGIHSLHETGASGAKGLQAYPERLNMLSRLGFLFTPAPKLQPAQGAKVTILVPKDGEVFHGDQVPLRYDFTPGKVGNHVHAYVDGELMGMFSDPSNNTLNGIKPGKHVLELRVTTDDHVTELDATDKVGFVVQ